MTCMYVYIYIYIYMYVQNSTINEEGKACFNNVIILVRLYLTCKLKSKFLLIQIVL